MKRSRMNASSMKKNLRRQEKKTSEGIARKVVVVTLKIMAEAQRRVPVESGHLKSSAGTDVKKFKNKIVGTIYFLAEYALPVHDILTAVHPVGEALFLENAIDHVFGSFEKAMK